MGLLFKRDASQLGWHEKGMAKDTLQRVISLLWANEIFIFQRQQEMERPRAEDSLSIFGVCHALQNVSHLDFRATTEVNIVVSTLQMCVLRL